MRERLRNKRKVHFLETINTFGSLLMSTSTTKESAWCVAKHAVGELGYIDCIIYLINDDDDDGALFQCAAHGNKNPTAQDVLNPIKLKIGEGICGQVALTGVSEIIADTSKDPRYIVDDEDRYSEITVPILSDGAVIGIIDSEHPEKNYFSDHDLNILSTIASMLSFKISQAKAIEELAITNKELTFQNEEKQKQARELAAANVELAFQNEEKEKRARELAAVNAELAFQNEEKEKRADELAIINTELTFQNEEKQKRADELALANIEKEKQANALNFAIKELSFQRELASRTRTQSESVAKELRQFIETANAPIFGIDNKGRVNEWNQTSEKITGFKKEDVLGQNLVKTYITEDYRDAVKKVLDNALKGQETANYEFPLFTKDGQRVMVLLNSSTRRNAEGKIVGVLGVVQDISEMDKLRTQSESVAKELRQFIETANAPIFGIDNKGRVNEWNQTSEKITGFKKEDVLRKNLVQTYITRIYQKQVKEVLDNALKGQETANYEFPLFTKDGQRVMVLLNASTRRNADGEIVGVLGVGQDISEMDKLRTQSESVAKELRQFIETANAPIFGIDNKGRVNEWNQTSEKITGFKKEDVLGQNLVKTYITEDYRDAVKKVLDNALKGQETANYEFPLFTKDGQRVMVLLNASTRRNAEGKIVGVLGVGQDISEMDKLRTQSESVAKELRQFIETANAPIFGIDNKGRVNEWNQTSEKITGFKKEDVLGKDLLQTYITQDYQKQVKEVLDNALKGQETANYEFPLFTKMGQRVMVLLNASTRRNSDGKIVGVLGVGQDISEIDKLRTESESVAKELRQFIETANAPIFGIDNKGRVNEWNQTSVKITGFKKEDVLGKDLVETYITEDYQKQVKEVLDNALKGQEIANYEFPLFTKKGQRLMVLLNASTRRNAEGEIVGVLGVGQDITILNGYKENLESKVESRTRELQESLEREKELGRLKTSFVSMASHEFRTPLTSIKATSDVILRYFDKLSKDDINKRLEKIKREVEDMTTMLEDILIIGKSNAQKLKYNPELLNIVSLIKNIINEYQLNEFENRSIVYKTPLPVIFARVDKKWIKHIIINLFSNAIKYSDQEKQIEISIKKDKNGISFSFKDYGIGISKQDIKELFTPFHRGKNVQDISGTGLGLSILQKAVELHKGKIEVKSKIGKGSNFKIILPKQK